MMGEKEGREGGRKEGMEIWKNANMLHVLVT